jgi:hypothetical protein
MVICETSRLTDMGNYNERLANYGPWNDFPLKNQIVGPFYLPYCKPRVVP